MSQGKRDEAIYHIVDYLLNEASESELDAVEEALRRRRQRGPLESMNFQEMARKATSQFQMNMPDFQGITRGLVRNLILQHEPGISSQELEVLLDHYVPSPEKERARDSEREKEIPAEILQSMIRQFVSYSLGRMSDAEEKQLRDAMPDWPGQYWNAFSQETRTFIRDLVRRGDQPSGS